MFIVTEFTIVLDMMIKCIERWIYERLV